MCIQPVNINSVAGYAMSQATLDASQPPPFEVQSDQSATADVRRARLATTEPPIGGISASTDVVDVCRTSRKLCDLAQVTATCLEGASDGIGNRDPPDWLVARRRHLDNQILRRQLRCQRAEALVAEQFNVVHKK